MISLTETGLFSTEQLKVLSRLKVKDVRDLFYYLPRKYIDRTQKLDLRSSRAGDLVTVVGQILHAEMKFAGRRRFTIKVEANGFIIYATFFNAGPYLQKVLQVGTQVACWGKLEVYRGRLSFMHPEWEVMTEDGDAGSTVHTGRIVPIYRITEGMRAAYLTVKSLRQKIETCLQKYEKRIADYISPETLKAWQMPGVAEALHKIHFPATIEETEYARRRMAFDELMLFSVLNEEKKAAIRRIEKSHKIVINLALKKEIEALEKTLPFELTSDQKKAIFGLMQNSTASYPVNHLLMGDVGSGKTLVALLLALVYMRNGLQVAYLAPTEILARQHYQTFLNILPGGSFEGVELIIGKDAAKERRAKLDRLARGDSRLAIGTHALIQDDVSFQNLALIIIDEQHRFGVEQREKLRAKGKTPDLLSMTATPIPRTLTLAYYGDLEPFYLKEKPKDRLKIDTRLFAESDLDRIYKAVRKYVSEGRQVYIIYPVIEESENSDMASLVSEYAALERDVFPDLRLGLLHGRLTGDEKERAMQKFKEGLIQVLVATTVVEVGIDVPNANVIVIRNPDRFGLSQLHQLRGRVGRGEHQSFCILVAPDRLTAEGQQRLDALVRTDDGFELAQTDFQLRGAGEMTGLRQSGASEFHVADLRIHGDLLDKAVEYLQSHPEVQAQFGSLKNIQQALEKGLVLFGN
ncbi:ATP-dependent DNA helicase RecG [Turneriella parva]|uniref:Probable DNA 3'-5' helicase RecG n=1 Tax=Turneriella parva (strain ATCC BAA-1111 / DSM 21527 / NCTC 11395 / H) TaxID=869212 RepID=I4B589_TURPD|nr:ATP-dependent DNA helicase RecG [Turneriella parva]AFM12446.1 ATP-dependent DNA helicase RecG [Turneriella parva DSM 21527]